jgi:hypothetical protein
MAKRGRPTVRVTISPSERTTLEQWARRRTPAQGLAQRAQIVLACVAGRSNSDIAIALRSRGKRPAVGVSASCRSGSTGWSMSRGRGRRGGSVTRRWSK